MKEEMNVIPGAEKGFSRRKFLGYAGGIAGAGLLISSCKKKDDVVTEPGAADLGVNDDGLLNLLFVIQQVEADYYAQILATPYTGMTDEEKMLLTDMKNHEIAHRELLRNYLKGRSTEVSTDFSSVDFSNIASVLNVAAQIEDLSTQTGNSIAHLLAFSDNAALILKITSVEARHAGTVSNMKSKGAFFNPVDVTGAEPGMLPSNAIITLNKFLSTKVAGNNLPNK